MKYRVNQVWSLRGIIELVDLGDQSYGEWIIYENKLPRFHISCFRTDSESNSLLNQLIQKNEWSIERVIDTINQSEKRSLRLYKRPFLSIITSTKLREINLVPLPIEWIKTIKP
ncbi:MAG: hypothetical protein HWE07_04380 [Cytophagia bacterium]|nr:hypothetical protein [Cytophagia bacterium]